MSFAVSLSRAADLVGMVPAGSLLAELISDTASHPKNLEKKAEAVSARLESDAAALSFADPVFSASAGSGETPLSVPSSSFSGILPVNSVSAQTGIEAPFAPGVYAGAGVSQRRLTENGESSGDSATLAGGMVRIPLLKDRGFSLNGLSVSELALEAEAANASARITEIAVSCDIVRAYSAWLHKCADADEVKQALDRAGKLVASAAERAKLEDIAEYQIFPAQFEAAVRREELKSVQSEIVLLEKTLAEKAGLPELSLTPPEKDGFLLNWARAVETSDLAVLRAINASNPRPEIIKAETEAAAAGKAAELASENSKSKLDIHAGTTWNTEEDDDSGNRAGYEIALVYSRPLGKGGSEAKESAAKARAEAAKARLLEKEIEMKTGTERAFISFESAKTRLALTREAVDAARLALNSENERFALGEGSSRNVLDAQKDLTTASRRSLAVAAELISSMADLRQALGIAPDFNTVDNSESSTK